MRKGFTLIELMVVLVIIGVLSGVMISLIRGRVNAARWSEAKAAMGTLATSIRAFCAEQSSNYSANPDFHTDLGFASSDLVGTYFTSSDYDIGVVTYTVSTGSMSYTISATNGNYSPTKITLTAAGIWGL